MAEEKSVTVSNPWFNHIKDGKKKIEGRLNVGYFSKLKKGDKMNLSNQDKTENLRVVIEKIEEFKTFHDLPGWRTIKRCVAGH